MEDLNKIISLLNSALSLNLISKLQYRLVYIFPTRNLLHRKINSFSAS